MLGTWVDESGERKAVKVNVNPDAVEDQHNEHTDDLQALVENYKKLKVLAEHARHQLFDHGIITTHHSQAVKWQIVQKLDKGGF